MTLSAWLKRATAGLPAEVAVRVRTEYTPHVADSGLAEAQAVAALGEPGAVRRGLARTYLTWEELETLRDGRGLSVVQPIAWGVPPLSVLATVLIYADAPAFPWWRLAAPALTALLTALIWRATRSLAAEQRTLWRVAWGGIGVPFMLWLGWLLSLGQGENDLALPWMLPLMAGLFLIHGFTTLQRDRRLSRTLALTGGDR